MTVSRYWRLVGIATPGNGALELSEARIYENGVLADAIATLSATIAPASGALADLRDGVATGVVAWPYASYSSPGFALVWDFGEGGGFESPALRLGSGNSNLTFAADLTAQSSVDGINWTFFNSASNVVFPGVQALTPVPSGVLDPNSNSVVLLLHGNGVNGSTSIVDSSPTPKTVTPFGNAQISTAQSKFGGASVSFNGTSSYLSIPNATDFSLTTGDFTVECWIYPLSLSASEMAILTKDGVYGVSLSQYALALNSTGKLSAFLGNGNGVNPAGTSYVGTTVTSLSEWHHVALVRSGAICLGFLDGKVEWSAAAATMYEGSKPLLIGYHQSQPSSFFFNGYIDELRITKGVARYTADFAVPTVAFSELSLIQTGTASARTRQIAATPERLLPAVELPTTTAHGHLRELPFFDVFNGGIGLITGTVKEKSSPSNVPLARKVWLMDEASGMVVRETWSDATTGTYEFRGIKQGAKYTVLAYDYTGLYRAVIADAQVPGAMS